MYVFSKLSPDVCLIDLENNANPKVQPNAGNLSFPASVNVGSRVLVVMYHVDCTLCLYTSIGCYILLILPLLYFWVTVSGHLIFLLGC